MRDMNNIEIQSGVFGLLKKNYKQSHAIYVYFNGNDISITDDRLPFRYYPFAAKKILAKYPQIRMVYFLGGWTTHVYSRETLKWLAI